MGWLQSGTMGLQLLHLYFLFKMTLDILTYSIYIFLPNKIIMAVSSYRKEMAKRSRIKEQDESDYQSPGGSKGPNDLVPVGVAIMTQWQNDLEIGAEFKRETRSQECNGPFSTWSPSCT
jgi:hypothetical protein